MKNLLHLNIIIVLSCIALYSCQHQMSNLASNDHSCCSPTNKAKNSSTVLSCKLSTPEFQKRKLTVLASLKKQVLERKELPNGYAFRFVGSDKVLDELTDFIRTERECCDFFIFNLSISGDKSQIWLELTGVEGAKDFITQELEL